MRTAIEAAGARLLFLLPDNSDLNPIEVALSQLRAGSRKAAERNVEGLWPAIRRLIDTVKPNECAKSFAAAWYDLD